jgi:hypothetical protein
MEIVTPHLALPLLAAGQAQKHVTHNEALMELDRLVQGSALARTFSSPPASPSPGDSYIVGASPSGLWAGHAGHIATFLDNAWSFLTPKAGMRFYIEAEQALVVHTGTAWEPIGKVGPVDRWGINAMADATNRLAIASHASLFNHAGTSHRLTINRQSAADTASVVFSENFSGRAEIGSAGAGGFQIKVSANGSSWKTALTASAADGNVGVGTDAPVMGFTGRTLHLHAGSATDWAVSHYSAGAAGAFDGMIVGKIGTNTCVWNYDATALYFGTAGAARMTIAGTGQVGIGTTTPTTTLDVAGAIRCGSSTVAALPSAAAAGAGAMLFVSNESGGPVLAFSDGAAWRRVTDRTTVS